MLYQLSYARGSRESLAVVAMHDLGRERRQADGDVLRAARCRVAHPLPRLRHHRLEIGRAQRLNSSHSSISYAVFCLKKKKNKKEAFISKKKKKKKKQQNNQNI